MDTYFVTSEVPAAGVPAALAKAREFLSGFSLNEMRDDDYEKTVADAELNWKIFTEEGLSDRVATLKKRPYRWRRLSADIEVEERRYDIELFVFPASASTAAVSLRFSRTFYDALYSFKPSYEDEIDAKVKRELLAICLMTASSFSADAFAFRPLIESEDLASALGLDDVRQWLTAPTQDAIRHWRFLIVGVQTGQVARQQVEQQWPADRLSESTTGFLVYDGIVE